MTARHLRRLEHTPSSANRNACRPSPGASMRPCSSPPRTGCPPPPRRLCSPASNTLARPADSHPPESGIAARSPPCQAPPSRSASRSRTPARAAASCSGCATAIPTGPLPRCCRVDCLHLEPHRHRQLHAPLPKQLEAERECSHRRRISSTRGGLSADLSVRGPFGDPVPAARSRQLPGRNNTSRWMA